MTKQQQRDLIRQIRETQERLTPLLPDMDPGDLHLILERIFRPDGTDRRFFIREISPGRYGF